jgi:hypothetical protein
MYCWYQLPLGEVNALTSEGFLVAGTCVFNYTKRKKRYLVDTHESAANKKYQKEQTSRYLWREGRMYRWYQLPLGEVNALTSEGFFGCRQRIQL